jgi:mono/diheme cytochrome c family protein
MKMKTKFSAKIAAGSLLLGCLAVWSARAGDDPNNIWDTNCAACHGKDGKGHTMMGRKWDIKDLTDPKVQDSFDDAKAAKTIKEGVTDKGVEKMKAFGDKLTDDDIKALVARVRSFKPAK